MSSRLYPVILSGGAGSRLWPVSRESYPKQLLPLASQRTMLQETALRASGEGFAAPLVVCNQEHRFMIAEQLQQISVEPRAIILEPFGRNTAAAVAVAALSLARIDADALMLVMPADHLVSDEAAFLAAVEAASAAASAKWLVTFGITPTAPETGYGYIRAGNPVPDVPGVQKVAAFVEKPPRETAEEYLKSGDYLWNSGIFLFPVRRVLEELERHAPEVLSACRAALEGAVEDLDFCRLDPEAFAKAPNISVDYAVMERTDWAAVVPASMGWTDVGAWSALWEVAEKDGDGNVLLGDVITTETRNSYVRSDHGLVATLGLDDIVIVNTDDVVLVAHRSRVQDVKKLVEQLKQAGRSEPLEHKKIYRPWGFYQSIHDGERFQVKRLTVKPGAKLSLQKHFHRAEHWVVVNGTALVTRDDEQILLRENESIYIPLGAVHRLENPGKVPLNLIEVQSGAYLGEDDIVRISDTYGRS